MRVVPRFNSQFFKNSIVAIEALFFGTLSRPFQRPELHNTVTSMITVAFDFPFLSDHEYLKKV